MSELIMIVWDVQHGNAIYMRTPNGTNIMFDIGTGSYGRDKEFSPLQHLKKQNPDFKLGYLVISHPHADHISDIYNLFKYGLFPDILIEPLGVQEEFIYSQNRGIDRSTIDLYLKLSNSYTYGTSISNSKDITIPSNLGGIKVFIFQQFTKGLSRLNNYSIVAVVEFAGQKIILPGDIEKDGWEALIEQSRFIDAIRNTTILVASHHGRESGYCADIFNFFKPDVVIVSDGRFSDTSVTHRYTHHAQGAYVTRRSNRKIDLRYVLTTRKDGPIYIHIDAIGNRFITVN